MTTRPSFQYSIYTIHDRMRKEIVYKGSTWKDGCNANLPELLCNLELTCT